METRLSTKPITHVVITTSGSHYMITGQTNKMLEQASLDDLVELDGGTKIKTSSIMEILPINNYYSQFPDRKPAPELPSHQNPINFSDFRSEQLSRNGLASMIRGIKKAIDEFRAEGKEPTKALALLDRAEKAYRQKYGD